jgi:hypothetical protein
MSAESNVQIVKDFLAAMGGDKQGLLAPVTEDIEWTIPGEDWPLAGMHRGHAGVADVLRKASEAVETSFPQPPEFVGREIGFWSSASLREKSRQRTSHSRTIGSSTLPFETGKWRNSGSISTRRHWRGPPRWTRAQALTHRNRYHTKQFVKSADALNSGNVLPKHQMAATNSRKDRLCLIMKSSSENSTPMQRGKD